MSALTSLYKKLIKLGLDPDEIGEIIDIKDNIVTVRDDQLNTGGDIDPNKYLLTTGNGTEVILTDVTGSCGGLLESTTYDPNATEGILIACKYEV